ncbi:psmD2, partial [Symbiodinium sp. KB8]
MSSQKPVAVDVPVKDPEKPDDPAPKPPAEAGEDAEETLVDMAPPGQSVLVAAPTHPQTRSRVQTQEDRELKSRLEAAVEAALSGDDGELEDAVDTLRSEMQTATSSMTSVPKPLKFLSPFYDKLRELHAGLDDFNPNKAALAEVLSVLGMVNGAVRRDALRYCLLAGTTDVGAWGHDYLRHLAGEIGATFDEMTAANPDADVSDLMALVDAIVPYNMEHNAEAEAVDLLLEMGSLVSLPTSGYIDEHNYQRVCAYLLQCADYLGDADEVWEVLDVAFVLYLDQSAFNDALRVALRLGANSGAGMVEGGEALERRQVVAEV